MAARQQRREARTATDPVTTALDRIATTRQPDDAIKRVSQRQTTLSVVTRRAG